MLCQPKSAVHKSAATGGTSKEIMSSILPLKRPTVTCQGRIGTAAVSMTKTTNTIKPTQTRICRKK